MDQGNRHTHHIYGRKSHPEPLVFLGRLEIESGTRLKDEALKHFGETGWVELIAFPEVSIVPVIPVREPRGIS